VDCVKRFVDDVQKRNLLKNSKINLNLFIKWLVHVYQLKKKKIFTTFVSAIQFYGWIIVVLFGICSNYVWQMKYR
jgi:hypothetical protein